MRLLVVAPHWIGDAVMAQPMIRLLRTRWPKAGIDVLAPSHVAPIVECFGEVDRTIAYALERGRLQWSLRSKLAARLRAERYERAFVLPNSAKSALVPWLARIPIRIGYAGEFRFGLLNRRLPNPRRGDRPPMASHYAALAVDSRSEWLARDFKGLDRPRLQVDAATVAIAKAKFLGGGQSWIAFCPGAEFGPAKRWPAEQFARLAELIAAAHPDLRIACLGGPGDAPIAARIVQAARAPVVDLCGHTSIREAAALMKSMRAVVTNDTGLMHVAAALDAPVVALFGSTDPEHTPPHSPFARIEKIDIACSPCFQRECPLGHFRCMRDLTPERVMTTLAELLAPLPA